MELMKRMSCLQRKNGKFRAWREYFQEEFGLGITPDSDNFSDNDLPRLSIIDVKSFGIINTDKIHF